MDLKINTIGFFIVVFIGIPWHIYQEPTLPWWFKVALYVLMLGVLIVHWQWPLNTVEVKARSKSLLPARIFPNLATEYGRTPRL